MIPKHVRNFFFVMTGVAHSLILDRQVQHHLSDGLSTTIAPPSPLALDIFGIGSHGSLGVVLLFMLWHCWDDGWATFCPVASWTQSHNCLWRRRDYRFQPLCPACFSSVLPKSRVVSYRSLRVAILCLQKLKKHWMLCFSTSHHLVRS